MIAHYDWSGGREAMVRFGPTDGPVVIVANALFEEANRTRALIVAVLRGLAERDIGGALPDLPGAGESLLPVGEARIGAWRDAYLCAAVAANAHHSLAIRGGALIDDRLSRRWHLSPVEGTRLVREMVRTRQASSRESGDIFDAADLAVPGAPVELAGNYLSREMIADLEAATPEGGARVVRLGSDPLASDQVLHAPPPWRRAEPDFDATLAALMIDDIADWVHACAA